MAEARGTDGKKMTIMLDAGNYYTWRKRAQRALRRLEIWEAIDPGYGEEMTSDQAILNRKAENFVLSNTEEEIVMQIEHLETAKDMWDELKEMFDDPGSVDITDSLAALANMKMEVGESVASYLEKFTIIQDQLEVVDFETPDVTIAAFCLGGLLPCYKRLRDEIVRGDVKLLKMSVVKGRLFKEEKNLKLRAENDENRAMVGTSGAENNGKKGIKSEGNNEIGDSQEEHRENQNYLSKSPTRIRIFRWKK